MQSIRFADVIEERKATSIAAKVRSALRLGGTSRNGSLLRRALTQVVHEHVESKNVAIYVRFTWK